MKADDTKALRCDECGRFIPWADFAAGLAYRQLDTPDSHFTAEAYITLCQKHKPSLHENKTNHSPPLEDGAN